MTTKSRKKVLKIAYVTHWDPNDIHSWSGVPSKVLDAFKKNGFEIEIFGNLTSSYSFIFKIKRIFYTIFLSKNYHRDREPIVLKNYARQILKKLKQSDADIVFSPSSIPVAYLETNKPIVFWTDATFAGMLDFYPSFTNMCKETIRNGNQCEQLALDKSTLVIYENSWAKETAINNYNVDSNKIKVVPFGSNISGSRNLEDIERIIRKKDFKNECRLLFIGAEWERKGGDFAVQITKRLLERGLNAKIDMVGQKPKDKLPHFVRHHGFISRKSEEGRNLLQMLLEDSHFFILPTKADAMPLVFGDVCSYGMPSLTTRVGGTREAIRDGLNGQSFDLDAGVNEYCDYIIEYFYDPERYFELALSSFHEYEKRLNWDVIGRQVSELIKNTLKDE